MKDPEGFDICPDCLCHYLGEHDCPPWLKAMVSMSQSKRCPQCFFEPDENGKESHSQGCPKYRK